MHGSRTTRPVSRTCRSRVLSSECHALQSGSAVSRSLTGSRMEGSSKPVQTATSSSVSGSASAFVRATFCPRSRGSPLSGVRCRQARDRKSNCPCRHIRGQSVAIVDLVTRPQPVDSGSRTWPSITIQVHESSDLPTTAPKKCLGCLSRSPARVSGEQEPALEHRRRPVLPTGYSASL